MTQAPPALRIGDVARLVGTTPRTIRYYEERGLLGESSERPSGTHRTYSDGDVERLRELIRLRELLGLSLEELGRVMEAEEARAVVRREIESGITDPKRLRALLDEALGHLDLQLSLVRRRLDELQLLHDDLQARRARAIERLAETRVSR